MNRTGSKRRSSCVDEEVRSNSVIRKIKTLFTRPASLEIALYRRCAFRKKVCTSTVLRRVFDKAVRRKPPVVAADAGLMQIQLREGVVWTCAEVVRQSTTDGGGSWKGDESARLVRIRGL
jgi:hypothetical protein